MPIVDPTRTLSELVNEHPCLVDAFERHEFDYCCGGRRTLLDVAAGAGVDLGALLTELAAVSETVGDGANDWIGLEIDELADHIEATHHAYLKEALPRLEALAVKVEGVHADAHPELHLLRRLIIAVRADLEPHLEAEEQVLFPMIRELAGAGDAPCFHCGSIHNPIDAMSVEHDRAGELLSRIRAVSGDYEVPDDACASYRALYEGLAELEADIHLHVHKENNLLFPKVLDAEMSLVHRAGSVG